MSQITKPNIQQAQKWLDAGINETGKFQSAFQAMREHAFRSGFLFMKARDCCPQGEWGQLLISNANRMKPRTVQFWIALAEAGLAWTREMCPEISPAKAQEFTIKEVLMLSPKPLVALLRELKKLRPFGEYDAVKYATRKLGTGQQLELNFAQVIASFDALDHLGESNFTFLLPAGANEEQALTELKTRLERALVKINESLEDRTRPLNDP